MAKKYDIEKVINDISLTVATDFLQLLFKKELVKIESFNFVVGVVGKGNFSIKSCAFKTNFAPFFGNNRIPLPRIFTPKTPSTIVLCFV